MKNRKIPRTITVKTFNRQVMETLYRPKSEKNQKLEEKYKREKIQKLEEKYKNADKNAKANALALVYNKDQAEEMIAKIHALGLDEIGPKSREFVDVLQSYIWDELPKENVLEVKREIDEFNSKEGTTVGVLGKKPKVWDLDISEAKLMINRLFPEKEEKISAVQQKNEEEWSDDEEGNFLFKAQIKEKELNRKKLAEEEKTLTDKRLQRKYKAAEVVNKLCEMGLDDRNLNTSKLIDMFQGYRLGELKSQEDVLIVEREIDALDLETLNIIRAQQIANRLFPQKTEKMPVFVEPDQFLAMIEEDQRKQTEEEKQDADPQKEEVEEVPEEDDALLKIIIPDNLEAKRTNKEILDAVRQMTGRQVTNMEEAAIALLRGAGSDEESDEEESDEEFDEEPQNEEEEISRLRSEQADLLKKLGQFRAASVGLAVASVDDGVPSLRRVSSV